MTTKAQNTISTKHDELEGDAERAITIFSKLNASQKKRHLATLQSMIAGSDKINKEDHLDWKIVAEVLSENELEDQLQAELAECGFSEDAQERAKTLFWQAVEQKVNDDDASFKTALGELLSNFCPSPLITTEKLNIVQVLADRIEELSEAIEYVENENAIMIAELRESLQEEKHQPNTMGCLFVVWMMDLMLVLGTENLAEPTS